MLLDELRRPQVLVLLGLCALLSVTMAPGVFAYDSLLQWYEGRIGRFESNQPPMLGMLWHTLDQLGSGANLLVACSCCCFCIGCYLVICHAVGPSRALLGVSALAFFPPVFVQLATINKETIGTNFLLLGFGLAVRSGRASLPWPQALAAISMAALATMTRYQLLAAAILLFLPVLLPPRNIAETWLTTAWVWSKRLLTSLACFAALLAGMFAWIDTSASVNWRAPVERTFRLTMIYEMASIAAADPNARMPVLDAFGMDTRATWALMRERYSPRSNIPLGDLPDLFDAVPTGILVQQRLALMADHDGVITRHRLTTFSNLLGFGAVCWPVQKRIITPLPGTPEMLWASTVNLAALRTSPATAVLNSRYLPVDNLLFRPVVYLGLAAILLAWMLSSSQRRRRYQSILGLPVAALGYAATFLPVTPSCDFRYLYPTVVFTCLGLAATLLGDRRHPKPAVQEH